MTKKYAVSVLDQAGLSAFHFALGLFLVRSWDAELFGVYSFWQTIVFVIAGIHAALITVPLSIHFPAQTDESDRRRVEALFSRAHFSLVIATVVFVLGLAILLQGIDLVAVPLVAYAATFLFREYVKGVAFARLHPASALWADLGYVSTCSPFFLLCAFGLLPLSLPVVFGVIGLGSLVGGVIGIAAERAKPIAQPFQATMVEYLPVWEQSRWALFGLFSSQLQLRGYVFLVSSLAGFAALGVLSAGTVLLRPPQMLYKGWARVARPQLAAAAAERNGTVFIRILGQGLGLMLAALAGLYGVLFYFWDHIETLVFSGRYEQIGFIVAGWSVVTACQTVRSVLQTAFAALNKFQTIAIAASYGAIVSLLATVGVLQFFHWTWVLAALALGETTSIGYLVPKAMREIALLRRAQSQPLREC